MKHADPLMIILFFVFCGLILFFLWRARHGKIPYVRKIGGISALEEAVGRATEMGKPVVFATGGTTIMDIITHASLAVMGYIARLSARLKARFICLARIANVYPMAEEIVREAYKVEGVLDEFNAEDQVRFLTEDSVVYAMTVARFIEENNAGCAMFIGSFDFTSLLMTEPGANMGVIQIAGDPNLPQVPFLVCTCDYTIIGEEFFAAGAYLNPDPTMRGTLASQDIIKLIFAFLILMGLICYQFDCRFTKWLTELIKHYQ